MKLVYTKDARVAKWAAAVPQHRTGGAKVTIGDHVLIDGKVYDVVDITKPHKPESTGRVAVEALEDNPEEYVSQCFPSVIGAEWIEREDREDQR